MEVLQFNSGVSQLNRILIPIPLCTSSEHDVETPVFCTINLSARWLNITPPHFQIIHQTLVKKASLLDDEKLVQILYSAWAILNDCYIPISAYPESTQTDPPASVDRPVQTAAPPLLVTSGCQTVTPTGPETRDAASQVDTQPSPVCANSAAQTEAVKLRTKWTQMRRRTTRTTGSQTDRSPSPPPVLPPPPPPPPLLLSLVSSPPPPLVVDSRAAGTQTPATACRTSETQTLLPQALPGRRATGTQTLRARPPWVVRLVRGVPPPPAERPPEPRRFHGRRLLRRDHEAAPPEIPLTTTTTAAMESPSAAAPADPRPSVS